LRKEHASRSDVLESERHASQRQSFLDGRVRHTCLNRLEQNGSGLRSTPGLGRISARIASILELRSHSRPESLAVVAAIVFGRRSGAAMHVLSSSQNGLGRKQLMRLPGKAGVAVRVVLVSVLLVLLSAERTGQPNRPCGRLIGADRALAAERSWQALSRPPTHKASCCRWAICGSVIS
jgi:hypothetical protein